MARPKNRVICQHDHLRRKRGGGTRERKSQGESCVSKITGGGEQSGYTISRNTPERMRDCTPDCEKVVCLTKRNSADFSIWKRVTKGSEATLGNGPVQAASEDPETGTNARGGKNYLYRVALG